jgi:hypothetical protein
VFVIRFSWRYILFLWCGLFPALSFALPEVGIVETKSESVVLIDYPEVTTSVASSLSVDVVWPAQMTYCSLITRMNLHRFTWLPARTIVGEQDAVLQWDAIRLIEQGIETQTFLPIEDLGADIESYFGEISAYSLFDLYFYTPHPTEQLTEKDYLFQWHRVVLLYAQDIWWVMDPLRGSHDRWRQQWDDYKLFLDPSVYAFVYNHVYRFTSEFLLDLPEVDTTNRTLHVTDLGVLIQEWVIVSELDTAYMPLASSFLKPVKWVNEWIQTFIPVGTVVRSLDNSPFNLWLLTTTTDLLSESKLTFSVGVPGKQLSFSSAMSVSLDISSIFPEVVWEETVFSISSSSDWTDQSTNCEEQFSSTNKKIRRATKWVLSFTVCASWTYTITRLSA